ncbi:hypothetical protein L2E82_35565 [Cichorium intybus]|uniref:Uncharacterized protein n=1 Tax=Cichorium intybus TaxID=13427 RepID=A0ACB9BP80_CICIN|nr:hypothetical protein L2E82_35565 [Cichorium intybus]
MAYNSNNAVMNYAALLGSNNKAPMLIPEHYDQWADEAVTPPVETEAIISTNKRKTENDKRCMRELKSGLPPIAFNLIRGSKSAKEIWDRLKMRYEGSDVMKKSKVNNILADFSNFKQLDNEKIDQTFERFTNIVYELEKHEVSKTSHETNFRFMQCLRREWKQITMMIKLVINPMPVLLPSSQKQNPMISLKLMMKPTKPAENSKPKSETTPQPEKKLLGDSVYDCNYCFGKNHLAKDYMLRKANEKKERVKDEAYYTKKLEEIWSSGSDDDEIRKPTHGAMFTAHTGHGIWSDDESSDEEKKTKITGVCLMVQGTNFSSNAHLTIPEQVSFLLQNFNVPEELFINDLNEITSDCLHMNQLLVSANSDACQAKEEVISLKRKLKGLCGALEKNQLRIDILEESREQYVKNNELLLKQRNIFCETAKRLYAFITRIYHSSDINLDHHKKLLTFIEFKLKDVDSLSYECESIVSSIEIPNLTYAHGVVPFEKFLSPNDLLKVMDKSLPAIPQAIKINYENAINASDDDTDLDIEEIDCRYFE